MFMRSQHPTHRFTGVTSIKVPPFYLSSCFYWRNLGPDVLSSAQTASCSGSVKWPNGQTVRVIASNWSGMSSVQNIPPNWNDISTAPLRACQPIISVHGWVAICGRSATGTTRFVKVSN